MTYNKKSIWQYPWGYRESFIIASGLLILGLVMNYFIKFSNLTISWPINIWFGFFFIIILLFSQILFKKKSFVKWLSSTPAAISAIITFSFLVLLMGLIPQKNENVNSIIFKSGLTEITNSLMYVFILIYLLTTLGMVILRRSFPFKNKNIAFFINHFGLWVILFTSALGAGDFQRIKITVNKINPIYSGINQKGIFISDLGIAIQLNDFLIEEYTPKAYIINGTTGDILNQKNIILEKGNKLKVLDWEIEVLDFYEYAAYNDSIYYAIYDIGATPAAFIKVTQVNTKTIKTGWVSCGSFKYPGNYLLLNNNQLLVMAEPEAKKYSSDIKIYTKKGEIFNKSIEVNKPASVNGYKIYQIDYDHKRGKWSEISVLELVKDPWLHGVYIGIFMLIAGAVYMFWISNKKLN